MHFWPVMPCYGYVGAKIEVMLKQWSGDYEKLEKHHGYIQWYTFTG
jgi:Opioid growth factor receptor (OGFr) conserved region